MGKKSDERCWWRGRKGEVTKKQRGLIGERGGGGEEAVFLITGFLLNFFRVCVCRERSFIDNQEVTVKVGEHNALSGDTASGRSGSSI